MIRILLRLYALYAVSPGQLALAGFCAVLVAGLGLALPWILKQGIDEGLVQRQPHVFYVAGGLLGVVTALRGVVTYGQNYLTASLSYRLAYRLRHLLYEQIQRLSFANHDRVRTGELMSRATADVEAVRLFFHFGLFTLLNVVLIGVGTVVAMSWLDWRLAGLTLLSFPLFLGVAAGIGHYLRPLQQRVQACTAALTVSLQESLAGIRVVKAFASESTQTRSFTRVAEA